MSWPDQFVHIYIYISVSFKRILPKKMLFLNRTVSLLLLVCAANCTEPDVCSDDGVFLGIARDREDIIYERSVSLQTMQPTNCDAGVRCRKFCSEDSFEWNFFEMRKASSYVSFTFHLGVCDDLYVLLYKYFERTNYPDFLSLVSWIYL